MTWSWNAPPIQAAELTASALLLAAIGLIAALRRGPWLTTLLFSAAFLSLAAFQSGTLFMLRAEHAAGVRTWAVYLARISALVSWLWLALSVVLARPEPRHHLRNAAAYLVLALAGCAVLFTAAGSPWVVREVQGAGAAAVVVFGPLGKIYLMYLVVAMVAVLMNLESMLRTAAASAQRMLRPLFLAILVAVLAELLVVSAGLLYGGVRVAWMAAVAPVLFVTGATAALALARRRLSDMSVPVARPVIYYSSVSLTLAGAFLLSMAVLSRLLPALSDVAKQYVGIAFLLFVGGGALLLMLSPATSRAIRAFIDRNFYANRYDYRREWERASSAVTPIATPDELCRQIESLISGVFGAERIAIHFRDGRSGPFSRLHGPANVPVQIAADHPLVRRFERTPLPVAFQDLEQDLDQIPALVESRECIQALHAEVCAPLVVGDDLVGLLWLSRKRQDEEYLYEDVEFLSSMARQLAANLWFCRQAEQLAESRQLESLNRLSSFVLHDIKNQISGLSLVVENARRHLGNPEFQRDAMAVVERTVASLRELMEQVSSVAKPPIVQIEPCTLRDLVEDALTASGLSLGEAPGVRVSVRVREDGPVSVDRRLLSRVLVNLLVNAREALADGGEIDLLAEVSGEPGARSLELVVRDTGRGMSEEFIRTRLYRPFSSTKVNGLGVGLAQTRGIVEAHGGRIDVLSRPGAGATFHVRVPLHAGGEGSLAHAAREEGRP